MVPVSPVNNAQERLEKAVLRLEQAVDRRIAAAERREGNLAMAQAQHAELRKLANDASHRLDAIVGRLKSLLEE